ncbi:MAG: sporulation protein YqfC [Bacillota bacterium]|nr:sporulation protein YqfC [Clostridia bacterium]
MKGNKELLKKQRAKFKSAFVNILEIPPDIALNLPRITMLGNLQLNIENHKGITEYSDSRIRIMVTRGYLDIGGNSLVLRSVQLDEIVINGEINEIKITITG